LNDRECVIAFAGRLIHGKGANYLIEAVAHSTRPLRLLIAGDGPERQRLESLTRSLGLGERVNFMGLQHDMPAFWRLCDVAVVPSAEFIEACPMAPLEAMACGRPVVATRNGGLVELIVDGKTGVLVPPGDKVKLADALDRYAESGELRIAHGVRGQARVAQHFNIKSSALSYLEIFSGLKTTRGEAR
jgi:glycosyltransferase involved in cell wall biosynthesis